MENSHSEIMLMLGQLTGKVDGINSRLDVSNGRLSKHDVAIQELKTYQDRQSGAVMAWSVAFSAVGSAIAVVASYILSKFVQ